MKNYNGFIIYENGEENYLMSYVGTDEVVTLPSNNYNYSIYQFAFFQNDVFSDVTISNKVTSIGAQSFQYCSNLLKVRFEDNSQLSSIGYGGFAICHNLLSITLPSSLVSIDTAAFDSCLKLIEIYNFSPLPITIGGLNYGGVGVYAMDIYTLSTSPSKIKYNGDYIFYEGGQSNNYLVAYVGNEKELTLPTLSYEYDLGQALFLENTTLTKITIPGFITSIGNHVFNSCFNLEEVTISGTSKLTYIGYGAFASCGKLKGFDIPKTVETICSNSFDSCSSIPYLVIPSSIEIIEEFAFQSSTNIILYSETSGVGSEWEEDWNISSNTIYWAGEWHYDSDGTPVPN